MSRRNEDNRVIRLRPQRYIHVLNSNTNVTRIEVGPATFIRQDHEQIVLQPTAMVQIPPQSYCIVSNPHLRQDGQPLILSNGQVKLKHGDFEVRLSSDWTAPFPLYPGESLQVPVSPLTVVRPNTALHVAAVRDFTDVDGSTSIERMAGDEWLVHGPRTYIPRIETTVLKTIAATVIKPNEALMIRARRDFVDGDTKRVIGETWMVSTQGAYLPAVFEEIVRTVRARVLTEKKALHLRATTTFTDIYGLVRKAGQEWLVTERMGQIHIPDVFEEVVGDVSITTLSLSQYCVVTNPVDAAGVPQLGKRELRLGERSFFLHPGEKLEKGVQNTQVLGEEEALLLRARESFADTDAEGNAVQRCPGEEWMLYGPRKYVPPVEVDILNRRQRIPLDENEGIYVRDKKTGKVFTIKAQTYMLKPNEELWSKTLAPEIEALLAPINPRTGKPEKRIGYKMVTYRVPHNAAVQIYDYKRKVSRVVFGPELVMLEPDEQFSIISLSGDTPKRPNAVTSLCLMLGPDFMSDTVVVETSDHARLSLKLSYNWMFDVDKDDPTESHKIFSVRDFIGDTCKAIASRVRGAVAATSFDHFHKNSATIIKSSVFGKQDANGDFKSDRLEFTANRLFVTNIDIQSVEPIEHETRIALQRSVQLAIEISTNSQEALANHEAAREEQIAEGKLERQKIKDLALAESEKKQLVELKSKTAALKSTGQAKAEAIAGAEAALIKGKAEVKQATLKAEAAAIRAKGRLDQLKLKQQQEIDHAKALAELEVTKAKKQAEIEAQKFKNIVSAIGADTIEAIAQAGPEMQAKLLEGLGLQGFLVTDGSSPINLFNTANGLVGNAQ